MISFPACFDIVLQRDRMAFVKANNGMWATATVTVRGEKKRSEMGSCGDRQIIGAGNVG